MEDLSNLAGKSLATDSMHAGNQVWDRSSDSAPGTASGDLGGKLNEAVVHDAPVVEMITHTPTVLHPEAPPVNKSPFPRPAIGGAREWKTSGEENRGPAPWQQE